ncbi:MAG TPA: polyribonucleotide nucleotidyltransferase [bacterium]|nr:polyribonucleotide nucleotidyltransferase [bacterium]
MIHKVETEIGGRNIVIETGKVAKQAGGSVTIRMGDSIVLVTAVVAKKPRAGVDFLPLTCEYMERTFAAGKIPGGFFKREGRPSELATLTSRFIDRPIRPLFPEGFRHEIQVLATVLSADNDNEPGMLAMTGASAALMLSDAPFTTAIAGVRVGRVGGVLKANPTMEELEASDIDLVVAGSRDAVMMVEGDMEEVSEADVVEAIAFAHSAIQPLLKIQEDLRHLAGKPKMEIAPAEEDEGFREEVRAFCEDKLKAALRTPEKQKRQEAIAGLEADLAKAKIPAEDDGTMAKKVKHHFEDLQYRLMRQMVTDEKVRIDGRRYDEIRPITVEVGLLPRAHGSALFTRGETQALVAATLGSGDDEQIIDALAGEWTKRFMLHYNFPPFCTGEVKPMRGASRREIGHGALAERSILRMIPPADAFPYTIRVVSEILESNGSSSMATVCGGTLSLMDAGVPVKAPVAGIAMGLVKEGDKVAILSDILGDEDHLGDMDFKVAGTEKGITGLQMDIKIAGVEGALLANALEQARQGRLHILGKMKEGLAEPRADLSPYAPRIKTLKIDKEKIGALIGPGGKNIRGIVDETGCKIDVEDDGTVKVYSNDAEAMARAVEKVEELTAVPELGKTYRGRVVKIAEFGAFVNIFPGTDGLLHVSEIDYQRVNNVRDVLNEGDEVMVKVIRMEPDGKIALSRKETMPPPEGYVPPPPREGGYRREGGFRDDRGGGRDRDRRPQGGGRRDHGPRRDR